MPGPDPHALWIDFEEGRWHATFERYFWTGNKANRQKRAIAIARRMARGDWVCRWCRDELPILRRADAQYCCEGCRKRAARAAKASCPPIFANRKG